MWAWNMLLIESKELARPAETLGAELKHHAEGCLKGKARLQGKSVPWLTGLSEEAGWHFLSLLSPSQDCHLPLLHESQEFLPE